MKNKKNFLVTGGTGFIGSNICKLLIKLGHNVTIFDNNSRGELKRIKELNNPKLINLVEGFEDIKKDYSVTEKADGERFFLYVDKEHYLIDRSLNLELVKKPFSNEGFYLLDVEKINNLILIFDIIIFNNKDVSTLSFDERYKLLHRLKLNNDFKIKHFYFKGNIFK